VKTILSTMLATVAVLGLALLALVYAGIYPVGADAPHTRPVHALLETLRQRSVARQAARIDPPADLADAERIRRGAGNYDAMCVGCHLRPGLVDSELSRGLYPSPPVLADVASVDPAAAFWVIRHGIKSSGMPAWGQSMDDRHIWDMVAFLVALPSLDADAYRALVAASDGHSHGGGEDGTHGADHHGDDAGSDHHHAGDGVPTAEPKPAPNVHRHADGSRHEH
jgi:mono/diheme cytochrome c family protein